MKETLSLRSGMSVRQRQLIFAVIAGCFIFGILVWGTTMPESAYAVDYGQKNLVPSAAHPFGTDHMGRDMLLRSVKGMSISLQIGIAAAFVSSCIALVLGTLSAAFGGKVDQFVLWLVDLCMGVPHILLILMISVMMGGGIMGVSVGVIVTHWPRLTRIIRAEVMQLRTQPYILAARQYGYSWMTVARRHFVPHVLPQYIIGLVLLFPHAIMHEAGISFLGYGLPLDMPAIGIILSESMRYLALGMWWLAFFPGFLLLLVVLIFDRLGAALRDLFDPQFGQE
ncbi:ABC transporter permease [Selenomonas noxia]|jgi:peptide/opine/nickel ABC superfamily ATP binding cassette transporter, membrane protein|uniref:ABC transporter permease n=1 Tax=Selenomonas noxia TaxID=135083 RepID=UPI0023F515F5|nr:ABC transporter permease [Selenomonas noxia]